MKLTQENIDKLNWFVEKFETSSNNHLAEEIKTSPSTLGAGVTLLRTLGLHLEKRYDGASSSGPRRIRGIYCLEKSSESSESGAGVRRRPPRRLEIPDWRDPEMPVLATLPRGRQKWVTPGEWREIAQKSFRTPRGLPNWRNDPTY